MKFAKKSSFKRLIRFVLCLLLCVSMLGTTGVFGAMQAFAEGHRYKLENVTGTIPTQAAYGHVINYVFDGTTWQKVYQKVVTQSSWGRAGRDTSITSKTTLKLSWGSNTLTTGGSDIVVIYDTSNPTFRRWESFDGEYTAYVGSTMSGGYGGAVCNDGKVYNKEVKADFIQNNTDKIGGAISNYNGTIGDITGDFIGNYTMGTVSYPEGGAISNNFGTIGDITGDFIGNYTNREGGAIYNFEGSIGNITGDFIGNNSGRNGTVEDGGAISNKSSANSGNTATIGDITGDFIGNYAKGGGGAIYNDMSQIGNIRGNFIGNYSQDDEGGAIFNYRNNNKGTIGDITGDFIGNYAKDGGGAISNNNSPIGNITGNFIGNYSQEDNGGAIGNWYEASLTVVTAEKNIEFSGNYVSDDCFGGAIYNASAATVNLNAGAERSITFVGSSDNDKMDSVHNEGTLYINKGDKYTGAINFANVTDNSTPTGKMYIENGTVNFSKDVTQANIYFNGGAISMDNLVSNPPFPSYRTLNINTTNFYANGGTFVIKTDLANGQGDIINIVGTVTGGDGTTTAPATAYVQVAYDKTAITGQTVTGEHTFLTLDEGQEITITAKPYIYDNGGNTVTYTPTVENKDGSQDPSDTWKITSVAAKLEEKTSKTTKAISDTAQAIGLAWLDSINNLQKRLGDLRSGEESNTGWVRFQRSMDDLNMSRKLNVSGNLYQIGYDFALKNDKQSCGYFGLSLERFDGNESHAIGGGDIKSTTFSTYYTKIYDRGHYFDFILRYGRYESESTSCDTSLTTSELTKLDYAMNGITLSGEYGYRAHIGKSGLYLEPQAEFIYGYLGGAKKTSSTGTLADIDSTTHFVSRLGLAFGQRVKNLNYYLRGSYYHDFAGSTNITYGDASYKQDGAQNWWEVSLGGGWNVSNTSYFYAELTKHFKDVSNSLNFNLGFRFTL